MVAGAVPSLRKQLLGATALQRVAAAVCVGRVAEGNPEAQRAFVADNAQRQLLSLLQALTKEERLQAAVALGRLAEENTENQAARAYRA